MSASPLPSTTRNIHACIDNRAPRAPPPPPPPGPVLVDIPKDVQQTLDVPDWDAPMSITAYMSRLPGPPQEQQIQAGAGAGWWQAALAGCWGAAAGARAAG